MKPRRLPIAHWPAADQALWQAYIANGFSHQWARKTPLTTPTILRWTSDWNAWLAFIAEVRPELMHFTPVDRVTAPAFRAYLAHMKDKGLKPSTIVCRLYALVHVLSRAAPNKDQRVLRSIIGEFNRATAPKKRAVTCKGLPLSDWPKADVALWTRIFDNPSRYQEFKTAAHLSPASRQQLKYNYSTFLGFLRSHHPQRLKMKCEDRVTPQIAADYVLYLRRSVRDVTAASRICALELALKYLCQVDRWSYLREIRGRLSRNAKPLEKRFVEPHELAELGLDLIRSAQAHGKKRRLAAEETALDFRDGLLLAIEAACPIRRRAVAGLRVDQELIRVGDRWLLDIPARLSKTKRRIEFRLSAKLSRAIDLYLKKYRRHIPASGEHDGLWPSMAGRPLDDGTIYFMFCRRTKERFGFSVSPHSARKSVATSLAPGGVEDARILLGHTTSRITEAHYTRVPRQVGSRAAEAAWDTA